MLLLPFNMANMDRIFVRLRAAVAEWGPDWLESQVGALIADHAGGHGTGMPRQVLGGRRCVTPLVLQPGCRDSPGARSWTRRPRRPNSHRPRLGGSPDGTLVSGGVWRAELQPGMVPGHHPRSGKQRGGQQQCGF